MTALKTDRKERSDIEREIKVSNNNTMRNDTTWREG